MSEVNGHNKNLLQNDWQIQKLGDLCTKITNGSSAKQYEEKVGLPISRIETIWNSTIDWNRVKYVKENDEAFVDKYALKDNDILFSHINSDNHLGKTAIFKNVNGKLIHGINLLLIRPDLTKINADFFNYQLNYLKYRGAFSSIAQKAVNQSSINQAKLKQFDIVVPPINQQQQIVSKIEELFSELDKGVEQLKTAQQQLKVYQQSVLKWAFEGKFTNENVKDGEELKSWKEVRLGDLMESVKNGYSKKPDDNGSYRILRISAVRPNNLNLNDYRTLKTELNEENEIRENDLLFTRYNGSREFVGVAAHVPIVNQKFYYPDKLIRCRPRVNNKYHSLFLQYASNTGKARDYILRKIKTTAGQTGISGGEIKQIPISLPSLDEQKKVVEEIESRLSVADKLEETIANSLQQAEALRQSILKKAFEGKLLSY
jgi:type I restriction enzyme, S subunit